MDALTSFERRSTSLGEAVRALSLDGRSDLTGAAGGSLALLCARLARKRDRRLVLLAADDERAARLASDLAFFAATLDANETASPVCLMQAAESPPYAETAPDRANEMARLASLHRVSSTTSWHFLVASAATAVRRVVPRQVFLAYCDRLAVEQELDRDGFVQRLIEAGYVRSPIVEDPGTFAVRGGIIDVFVPAQGQPARIELYGELIEAIRVFDPETQRTRGSLRALPVHPVREQLSGPQELARARERLRERCDAVNLPTGQTRDLIESLGQGRVLFGSEALTPAFFERLCPLTDYLEGTELFVFDDPAAVVLAMREELQRGQRAHELRLERGGPCFEPSLHYAEPEEILERATSCAYLMAHRLAVSGSEWEARREPSVELGIQDNTALATAIKAARAARGREESLGPLLARLHELTDLGVRVVLSAHTETQAERIERLLQGFGLPTSRAIALCDERPPRPLTEVVVGPLTSGFYAPADALAIITEEEIFGPRAHRKLKVHKTDVFLQDLGSLSSGDLVVHEEHGIGRYRGLQRRAVGDVEIDFLLLEFAGGDKLYLPVYRLSQVQKYLGGDGAGEVKLDRLGGQTFALKKARVKRAVQQMADGLLQLYAERKALPGTALPPPDTLYREFEGSFPFDETVDQEKAISDVLTDLEAPRPMDRLVCGDVGFGKTEVALRAAFRAVEARSQVAMLVPTTVLAQQHFQTFRDRMRDFPITIDVLSRFRSRKEQEDVAARLKEGKLDIVIGTHRLLSKDVHWKSLGLLVVDEEQRFGVAHKERIKALKSQIDVLTLTATPIPRTLHMAMAGLRDLSLITTPPPDRRAIRTFVAQMDENLIREAIERELGRGGQVFYVYNRVQDIEQKAELVRRLVPKARPIIAHGQMSEIALEKAMTRFVAGDHDVLIATSIVESGLDIPRANTMIIDRADMMGLAQLYQLRGRIGRSRERAYCYLIVPPVGKMTDEARERIMALERFSDLGAGFHIASLDLEIRGAGSLLGGEQSGHVAAVGFDLYCQMLEEAVAELKGTSVARDVEPELTFDMPGFLPDDYVSDTGVRLALYKRLSDASSLDEVYGIGEELADRYGALGPEARMLLEIMAIKVRLRRLRALGIEATGERVTLHLREDTPLPPSAVLELVNRPGSNYRLTADMRLARRFAGQNGEGLANAQRTLDEIEQVLSG